MRRRTATALWFALALAGAVPPARADEDELRVVRGYVAAWNAHDAEGAASHMAEDVTCIDVTVGEPKKGRESVRDDIIRVFMTAAPDLVWTVKGEPVADDGRVAFEWSFTGTNTGAWGPETPATGKPFAIEGMTLMRIDDGKIVHQADYYDGLGFKKQLGWID